MSAKRHSRALHTQFYWLYSTGEYKTVAIEITVCRVQRNSWLSVSVFMAATRPLLSQSYSPVYTVASKLYACGALLCIHASFQM